MFGRCSKRKKQKTEKRKWKPVRQFVGYFRNDAVNSRKNPFGFFLFFAKPFANFFEALQVEQLNYYGSELFQWGDAHFPYKCVLMQFFNAAEWTVRRSKWFDLAPSGVPAGWLVGSLFQAYSPYQFRSWPCPGFFEVLSFGMLEIHRFVRLGFPQFWKEIQSSGDSTVNNKQLVVETEIRINTNVFDFLVRLCLIFFKANSRTIKFATSKPMSPPRDWNVKKKCIHCSACVPSYNKHLFTSTFRFQSSKPVSDSFHARTWMGCCDQGTHQGGKKF